MALDLASAVTTHLDAVARRPGRRVPRAYLAWRLRDFTTNHHK